MTALKKNQPIIVANTYFKSMWDNKLQGKGILLLIAKRPFGHGRSGLTFKTHQTIIYCVFQQVMSISIF